MKENMELFASCLSGLETLLAEELKHLGIKRVRPLGGGVAFFCDIEHALSACLWSRLASRIMLVVDRVDARTADELYDGVKCIAWEQVVAQGASLAVRAHGMNDELRNTRFTALKVKDAICDSLREARGERPNIDTVWPDALIDVRIREGRATISFDLVGESLYRRAYLGLDDGEDAPLSCGMAAGLLAQAGWDAAAKRGAGLVDPACGDGYVVVEAAMVACDAAPNLVRTRWGFEGWAGYQTEVWNDLIAQADERFERGLVAVAGQDALDVSANTAPNLARVRFAGTSASSPAIARARQKVKRAGLRQVVSIEAVAPDEIGTFAARIAEVARGAADVAESSAEYSLPKEDAGADADASCTEHFSEREPFCMVASLMHADRVGDAQAVAEAAAFVAASGSVGTGGRFVVAGDAGLARARFSDQPVVDTQIGRERAAVELAIYDEPPQAAATILVPDSAGGAEHVVEVLESATDQFASRLHKNYKDRRKWARREGVTCYRVYDADLPDYAVAIDVYEGAGQAEGNRYVHIAEYAAPSSVDAAKAQRRFDDVLAVAPVVLGIRADHAFSKVRRRDKGGSQYRDAGRRSYVTQVLEDGYTLEIDLAGYLDTGIFLDHRLTRQMVGTRAKGKRFLNLFAYTGTATVHAAGGGAIETVTVDLSQTYLDWAQRNMEQNGFMGPEHFYERGDVMAWITECRRQPRRFDLIFVDPPTFSNSKAMGKRTWDVQRDHVELLIGVTRLLTEGGEAIFSCNLRSFKPDIEALAKYGVTIEDITASTIPYDFKRNPKIHHCYLVKRSQ